MSNLFQVKSNDNNPTNNNNNKPDFVPANLWLNIGVTVQVPNREFDENKAVSETNSKTVSEFVSIPVGLPLDTMKQIRINSTNKSWIDKAQLKNLILSELQKAASQLDPGTSEVITGLEMQILHRNVAVEEPTDGANPLIEQFKALTVVAEVAA